MASRKNDHNRSSCRLSAHTARVFQLCTTTEEPLVERTERSCLAPPKCWSRPVGHERFSVPSVTHAPVFALRQCTQSHRQSVQPLNGRPGPTSLRHAMTIFIQHCRELEIHMLSVSIPHCCSEIPACCTAKASKSRFEGRRNVDHALLPQQQGQDKRKGAAAGRKRKSDDVRVGVGPISIDPPAWRCHTEF